MDQKTRFQLYLDEKKIKYNILDDKEFDKIHKNLITASALYDLFKEPVDFLNNFGVVPKIIENQQGLYWGTHMESIVIGYINRFNKKNIEQDKRLFVTSNNLGMYAFQIDGFDNGVVYEIKTTKWLHTTEINKHYAFNQCLFYNVLLQAPVELWVEQNKQPTLLGTIDKNYPNYIQLKELMFLIVNSAQDYINSRDVIDIPTKEKTFSNIVEWVQTYNSLLNPKKPEIKVENVKNNDMVNIITTYTKNLTSIKELTTQNKFYKKILDQLEPDKKFGYDNWLVERISSQRKGNFNMKKATDHLKSNFNIEIDLNEFRAKPVNTYRLNIGENNEKV